MDLYYTIVFFIIGSVLGSFYNVVGYRLPLKQSLIRPGSHCPKCDHKLSAGELIPIFSYLIQGRKCKNCRTRISPFYASFELLTGILFAVAYNIYGMTPDIIIPLIFISVIVIVIISDIVHMVISDEVIIVGVILVLFVTLITQGLTPTFDALISGALSFLILLMVKLLGDFFFKRESMGGGDVKLMAFIGLVIYYDMTIIILFMSAFIALPVAIFSLKKNDDHMIPFGPFLCISALIIFTFNIDMEIVLDSLLKLKW